MDASPRAGAGECPDENVLARFAGGTLPPSDARSLEAHLDSCADCRCLVAAVASAEPGPGGAPTQLDTGAPTLPHAGGAPTLRSGDALGRYVVRERLGEGGMGVVYAAEDPELGRQVALKLLRRVHPGAAGEEARGRLLREAQAMARLSHPNVLPVFDLGTTADGQVFLALECVRGPTLGGWLRERERPWREVLALFLSAGRGLAAAHRAGLVHRDFKPANVLVDADGRPRVTDFGLARESVVARATEASSEALTSSVAGTPAYMAPEQHAGRDVDARADQFSFCVALYEALHGERPFDEDARGEARWRVRAATSSRELPRHVREALLRGLSLEPANRFESMDALLESLELTPPRTRRAWAVGLALGLSAVGLASWRGGTAREEAENTLLTLKVGEQRRLMVPKLTRVAVGMDGLVDISPRQGGELVLEGLQPGATHLLVWDTDGMRREYTLSITAP
ncbi:protein kinase [Myxococcaceae bacterium GXIMD 01537]